LRERACLEEIGVNRKIILKLIFEKWGWGNGLDDLDQDRGR